MTLKLYSTGKTVVTFSFPRRAGAGREPLFAPRLRKTFRHAGGFAPPDVLDRFGVEPGIEGIAGDLEENCPSSGFPLASVSGGISLAADAQPSFAAALDDEGDEDEDLDDEDDDLDEDEELDDEDGDDEEDEDDELVDDDLDEDEEELDDEEDEDDA